MRVRAAVSITERHIPATVAEAYATLVAAPHYPDWLVGAKRIREVSADWPARDSWFEHVVGFGPIQVADRTTSLGTEPDVMLELLVRARPFIAATTKFELTAQPGGGCFLRMTETPTGVYKVLSAVAGPLLRLRNERSLQRFAAVVSAGLTAEPT